MEDSLFGDKNRQDSLHELAQHSAEAGRVLNVEVVGISKNESTVFFRRENALWRLDLDQPLQLTPWTEP